MLQCAIYCCYYYYYATGISFRSLWQPTVFAEKTALTINVRFSAVMEIIVQLHIIILLLFFPLSAWWIDDARCSAGNAYYGWVMGVMLLLLYTIRIIINLTRTADRIIKRIVLIYNAHTRRIALLVPGIWRAHDYRFAGPWSEDYRRVLIQERAPSLDNFISYDIIYTVRVLLMQKRRWNAQAYALVNNGCIPGKRTVVLFS